MTLRSQTDVVTTDRNGRFRLPGDAVPPQIDVRTLGMDQRPGATPVNPWEIPIRTVGRLAVAIRRTQVTTVSQVASNATVPVVVTARDSVGREWRVVAGRDGIARFDALRSARMW